MKAILRAGTVVLAGAAAWGLAVPLVPATHRTVGPATLSAALRLGAGRTVLVTPPLGTISANTHAAPLDARVSLVELDVAAVRRGITSEDPVQAFGADVEPGLRDLARAVAIRYLLAAIVIGVLVGGLVPRRSWRSALVASTGATAAAALALTVSSLTFNDRGFEEPRFTGALRSAPDVIRAVQRGSDSIDELGSRYQALAERLSRLLALTSAPLDAPEIGTTAILHVSDIHSNPVGVEFATRLARAFDVDAVIDTGDLTSFGNPLESRLVQLVSRLEVPYLFVPGNHDSATNRRAIEALDNVVLLDGQPTLIGSVEIMGWPDPTFTASNGTSTEEGNAIRLQEAPRVAEAVRTHQPDLLAVHDQRLAQQSLGSVPLVLAGHTHERDIVEETGTTLLVAGSAGATGLGSFLVETNLPYEAQVIYLRDSTLVAVDYVTFSAAGGQSKVERRIFPETTAGEVGAAPAPCPTCRRPSA